MESLISTISRIGDVLDSIDLNPIIATLGESVSTIVNDTTSTLSGGSSSSSSSSSSSKRSTGLDNVLYSVNDYSGNTHTNRILGQDGNLYDVKLNNDGDEQGETLVGSYATLMTFTGHNKTISVDGVVKQFELQYVYNPFPGIEAVCYVYVTPAGKVSMTEIIAEAFGGGSSTISDDDESDL